MLLEEFGAMETWFLYVLTICQCTCTNRVVFFGNTTKVVVYTCTCRQRKVGTIMFMPGCYELKRNTLYCGQIEINKVLL